jgi:hypothetical protein
VLALIIYMILILEEIWSPCEVGRREKLVVFRFILMRSVFCAATLRSLVAQKDCLPSGEGIGGHRDDERATNEGRHHPANRAAVGTICSTTTADGRPL